MSADSSASDSGCPDWLDYGEHDASMFQMSDRDAACLVLADLDYDAQLRAIDHLLRAHRDMDAAELREIKEIEAFARNATGLRNERAVDEWVERLHESTYHDAARSMAAVGMLAPFVESLFVHAFGGIRRVSEEAGLSMPDHPRWSTTKGGPGRLTARWDCRRVLRNGRWSGGTAQGIIQLAEAVGLRRTLPDQLNSSLQALFEYRNQMFHNGFEWPIEVRTQFAQRLCEADWPSTWFSKATRGGHPWVFYLSNVFVEHALEIMEQSIVGIGAYCNTVLRGRSQPPERLP